MDLVDDIDTFDTNRLWDREYIHKVKDLRSRKNGCSIFHVLAIYTDKYVDLKYYIDLYGDLCLYSLDLHNNTIWHYFALFNKYIEIKKAIADYPRICYSKNKHGYYIWSYMALLAESKELLEIIKEHPYVAVINSVWFMFARCGDYYKIERMIKKFPYIEYLKNNFGTIWHYFAASCSLKQLDILVDYKPDVLKIRNIYGQNVLDIFYEKNKDSQYSKESKEDVNINIPHKEPQCQQRRYSL